MVLMVAEQFECTYYYCIVHLEMVKIVNFMLCHFYYNKKNWRGKRKKGRTFKSQVNDRNKDCKMPEYIVSLDNGE